MTEEQNCDCVVKDEGYTSLKMGAKTAIVSDVLLSSNQSSFN